MCGTRVHRQSSDVFEWAAGNQQNAAHRTLARNPQVRKKIEPQPLDLRAGNKTDVGLPVPQRLRAKDRKIETKIEKPSLRTVQESPDERPRVQVADSGNDQLSVYRMPFAQSRRPSEVR